MTAIPEGPTPQLDTFSSQGGARSAEATQTHMQELFVENAFKPPSVDTPTIREQLLSTQLLPIEYSASLPDAYAGTREQLLEKIRDTVNHTVDNLDYNGLEPFNKLLHQVEEGKTFRQIVINSQNEEYGSTCVGMSQAILKALKEECKIPNGMLAVQRVVSAAGTENKPFEHAAVIIQCSDGYILLDPRSDPNQRIFSVPFNSTTTYEHFSIIASEPGSATPLIIKNPERSYEYCTNVANGDDLVMKHYIMDQVDAAMPEKAFPVSVYEKSGRSRKTIWVNPTLGKITLKDLTTSEPSKRSQIVTFEDILHEGFKEKLQNFMGTDFHIPFDRLYKQLCTFASLEKRIKQIYRQTNIDQRF